MRMANASGNKFKVANMILMSRDNSVILVIMGIN